MLREADSHKKRTAAGRIEVGGLVETAEEREELRAALRTVPGAILRVQTVTEAMQGTAAAGLVPTGSSSETYSVTVRSGPMPLRLPLQQYFSRNGLRGNTADPVASLSNGAVTLSRSIMVEAWALRRLAERYRGNRKDDLPPDAGLPLQNMVQDHMSSLRLGVEKTRHLLEPALSSLFSDEPRRAGGVLVQWTQAEFGARPVSIYLVQPTKSEGLSMRSSPGRSQKSSPTSWRADFWICCPTGAGQFSSLEVETCQTAFG